MIFALVLVLIVIISIILLIMFSFKKESNSKSVSEVKTSTYSRKVDSLSLLTVRSINKIYKFCVKRDKYD